MLISAVMTYVLAQNPEYTDLMTATSHLTGKKIHCFTHIHQSTDDLLKKVKMLRMISQKTGTCYQRYVGFIEQKKKFAEALAGVKSRKEN